MAQTEPDKLHVIIPAYNCAATIGSVLRALPADMYEPYVIVNGSEDTTAEIARSFTNHTYEIDEQGKMPAIQKGLTELSHAALGPIAIIDADTVLLRPHRYAERMAELLNQPEDYGSVGVSGPVWFTDRNIVSTTMRSVSRLVHAKVTLSGGASSEIHQAGPNMGIHLKTSGLLDMFMSWPNIWPGEDLLMLQKIVESPAGRVYQTADRALLAATPLSDTTLSLADRIRLTPQQRLKKRFASYANRNIPGAISHLEFLKAEANTKTEAV